MMQIRAKKCALLALGVLLAGAPHVFAAPSVQVTAPNGGECLVAGGTYTVVWKGETTSHYAMYRGTDPLYQPTPGTWFADNVTGTAYHWRVPTLASTTSNSAVIWVEAHDGGHGRFAIDGSENLFTTAAMCGGAVLDTEPPTPPGNLTATAVAVNQIDLLWSPATSAEGTVTYRVFKNNTPLATVSGTTFADTGLAPITSASYFVVALDIAGNQSEPSGTATATTPAFGGFGSGSTGSGAGTSSAAADTALPSTPVGLTANIVTGTLVRLSWQASTDNVGVSRYSVYKNGALLTSVNGLEFNDTNVGGNANYNYTIQAEDAAGNRSLQSAMLSLTTPGTVGIADNVPPTVPTALSFDGSEKMFRWSTSTDNIAVLGYRVYREGLLIASVAGTVYTDPAPRATSTYTVSAYDASGNESAKSIGLVPLEATSVSPPVPPSTPPSVTLPPAPAPQTVSGEKPKPVFTKLLKRGSRGADVIALQEVLKEAGFFPSDVPATGFFGAVTERAVKAFQASRGIEAVGFTGPKTRAALNAE